MKIIIYNPQQFDLVFSIAAISEQAAKDLVIAIPTETADLNNPNFWRNQIPVAKEAYVEMSYYEDPDEPDEDYPEDDFDEDYEDDLMDDDGEDDGEDDDGDYIDNPPSEITLLEKIKQAPLYILGLGPEEDSDVPSFFNFFDQNEERIVLWIDDHDWKPEELKYLKNKIRVLKDESYLENLEQFGYTPPDGWKDMEIMMLTGEETYAPLIIRWRKALLISLILVNNLDDSRHLSDTLMNIVTELLTEELNEEIEKLCAIFPDMEESTEAAMEEISLKSDFFSLSTDNGIEVALFDLGEIKAYIDLLKIIAVARKSHDNVVLYYTIYGHPKIIIATKDPAISVSDIQKAIDWCLKDLNLDKVTMLRLIDGELVYQTKKNRARAAKKKFKKIATIKA